MNHTRIATMLFDEGITISAIMWLAATDEQQMSFYDPVTDLLGEMEERDVAKLFKIAPKDLKFHLKYYHGIEDDTELFAKAVLSILRRERKNGFIVHARWGYLVDCHADSTWYSTCGTTGKLLYTEALDESFVKRVITAHNKYMVKRRAEILAKKGAAS